MNSTQTIPKVIYQSWKTKQLPAKMAENVRKVKQLNPDYQHVLYDDEDCKSFLLQHFGQNYVNAFDILVPGAFKCDLWRYAMLYVNGGIYLDIDMVPLVPLDQLISPPDTSQPDFVSIVDRTVGGIVGIYQAFIACKPGHPILLTALQLSFANIATRRNGIADVLSITGPGTMATAVNLFWQRKNTNEAINPGRYDGILLYLNKGEACFDLQGQKIFTNKYEGYGKDIYFWNESYYKDDPRKNMKRVIFVSILGIIIIAILAVILSIILKKKLSNCQNSCSSKSV